MGLVDTEAIILRTYKLAEADKIVSCLTHKAGLVRGVARGARRLKSRFGASLEPFTIVALSYFEKEGRELVELRQAEIVRSCFVLAQSAEAIAAMEYLGELVMEFAPPHEPNEKLFRMVRACIEAIHARRPEEIHIIVRYFELWTLKLAGFLPDVHTCAACRRPLTPREGKTLYVSAEGTLQCRECGATGMGTILSTETHTQLRAMQTLAPAAWAEKGSTLPLDVHHELAQLMQRLITRALERAPRGQATFI